LFFIIDNETSPQSTTYIEKGQQNSQKMKKSYLNKVFGESVTQYHSKQKTDHQLVVIFAQWDKNESYAIQ